MHNDYLTTRTLFSTPGMSHVPKIPIYCVVNGFTYILCVMIVCVHAVISRLGGLVGQQPLLGGWCFRPERNSKWWIEKWGEKGRCYLLDHGSVDHLFAPAICGREAHRAPLLLVSLLHLVQDTRRAEDFCELIVSWCETAKYGRTSVPASVGRNDA